MKYLPIVLIVSVFFTSCQKELSGELWGFEPEPDEDEMQSCYISRISQIDTINNVSIGYLGVEFNSDFRATRVEDYDSISLDYIMESNIDYVGDTAWVAGGMYYVLDPVNRRVKKFVFEDQVSNPVYNIEVNYTYNGDGYLISKVAEYVSAGTNMEITWDSYTWSGGNLIKVVSQTASGDDFEVFFDYHSGIEVKNFFYLFMDPFDHQFELAFNFGKKSKNAVKTIWFSGFDENNNPIEFETTVYNYKLDAENQVTSFVVENNNFASWSLYAGKNQLTYKCR